MEGFVGTFLFTGSEPAPTRILQHWTNAFSAPGLEGDQVYSWTDSRLTLAWRLNPDIGDIHVGQANGYFFLIIGKLLLGENPIPSHSKIGENPFVPFIQEILSEKSNGIGISFLQKLNGSFLTLIYKINNQCLHIISDRFASRHLFYHQNPKRILFATDIRAVLADAKTPKKMNEASIAEFLHSGMIFEDRTLYDGIYLLTSATILSAEPEKVETRKYWNLFYKEDSYEKEDYYSEALANSFLHASNLFLSDSPDLGLMLSGGLDSRMICASMKTIGLNTKTFTFADYENGEVRIARRVADALSYQHDFFLRPPDYYRTAFFPVVRLSNGLNSFYHSHVFNLLSDVREQGVKTLVNGWGIDLLFSGSYIPRQAFYFLGRKFSLIKSEQLPTRDSIVCALLDELRVPADEQIMSLASTAFSKIWQSEPRDVIDRQVRLAEGLADIPYNQLEYVLVGNLSKFRSYLFFSSTRAYLRERNPLFDNNLLDLYLSTPPAFRFNGRAYRKALGFLNQKLTTIPYLKSGIPLNYPEWIEQFSLMLIPFIRGRGMQLERLAGRYRNYPAATHESSYPNPDLLVRNCLRNEIQDILLRGKYLELGLVEPKAITKILHLHFEGKANYGERLINLATLAYWVEDQ